MEKIIEIMIVIGILLISFVMIYILFCILWYGTILFDWILDNLFGLTDFLGMLILDTPTSEFNQDSWKNNYEDFEFEFEFKDFNQDYFQSQIKDPEGYYKILGIGYHGSQEEIVSIYHSLAKKYHPDCHPENKDYWDEMMKKINLAKEVLTDPIKRAEYDDGWK